MTINELTGNLEKSNDYLRGQSKRIVEQIAVQSQLNIKALVQRRIQQTGKDAKGKKFGNYSTKEIYFPLTSAFKNIKGKGKDPKSNKNIGKGKKKRLRKTRYAKDGYKEIRDVLGLPIDFVDFTFSGDMWANIGVTAKQISSDTVLVTVTGKNQITNDKLTGLSQRFGVILELNDKELELIAKSVANAILQVFERFNLVVTVK